MNDMYYNSPLAGDGYKTKEIARIEIQGLIIHFFCFISSASKPSMNFDKLFETDVTRNGELKNEKWEQNRRCIMGFLIWLGFKARFTHQENFSGCSTLSIRIGRRLHTQVRPRTFKVLGPIEFTINSGSKCFFSSFSRFYFEFISAWKRQNLSGTKMFLNPEKSPSKVNLA